MKSLTPRQAECLRFIGDYITKHGHAPKFQEIMVGLGSDSRSTIDKLLRDLVSAGYIRRSIYQVRGIEIVGRLKLPTEPELLALPINDLLAFADRVKAAVITKYVSRSE
jgi:SOS-response transcriptional repressor LexA